MADGTLVSSVRGHIEPLVSTLERIRDLEHIPASVFHQLGSSGYYRDRWRDGQVRGLPIALEFIRQVAPISAGVGLAASIHCEIVIAALRFSGRSPHQRALLDQALDGTMIGCLAATEDRGGSDLHGVTTCATPLGGDRWHLEGAKRYTTNLGTATHALVLARTAGGDQPRHLLFLVELGLPGVNVRGFFPKLGVGPADAGRLELDVHLTREEALLGPAGSGLVTLMRCLRYERLTVACGVLATARVALDLAIEFLRHREQFGQRLFDMQALKHRAGIAWTELEASEALLQRTVELVLQRRAREHHISAAKLHAARTANAVIDEALQMLGGRGYTTAFPIERFWRDVRLARIGGGSDEVMLETIGKGLDRRNPVIADRLDGLMRDELDLLSPDLLT